MVSEFRWQRGLLGDRVELKLRLIFRWQFFLRRDWFFLGVTFRGGARLYRGTWILAPLWLFPNFLLILEGGGLCHADRLELNVARRAYPLVLAHGRKSFCGLLGAALVYIQHSVVRIGGHVINQTCSVIVVVGHFLGDRLGFYCQHIGAMTVINGRCLWRCLFSYV